MRKVECPRCGDPDHTRIQRAWWMRLIPMSKRYECDACGHHFLCIRSAFSSQISRSLDR